MKFCRAIGSFARPLRLTSLIGAITVSTLAAASFADSARAQGSKPLTKCAPDAVVSGTACIDRFEASVWRMSPILGPVLPRVDAFRRALLKKIANGTVTREDLDAAEDLQVGEQLGVGDDDYGASCPDNGGGGCSLLYAVSVPGRTPSAYITWFQALRACKNAGKRLPTNAEWQAAVAGTPDTQDDGIASCNTTNAGVDPTPTGSRAECESTDGAFDMVGNLYEWVAEWLPRSTGCDGDWTIGDGDAQCLAGAATTGEPGALLRGGSYQDDGFAGGEFAGPLAVSAADPPSFSSEIIGFRCAR